jgi:hypothetical protein
LSQWVQVPKRPSLRSADATLTNIARAWQCVAVCVALIRTRQIHLKHVLGIVPVLADALAPARHPLLKAPRTACGWTGLADRRDWRR